MSPLTSPPSSALKSLLPTTGLSFNLLFFQLELSFEYLYWYFFSFSIKQFSSLYFSHFVSYRDIFLNLFLFSKLFSLLYFHFSNGEFQGLTASTRSLLQVPISSMRSFISDSLSTHLAWCIFGLVYTLGDHAVSLWMYWESDFEGQGHQYYQVQATCQTSKCSEGRLPQ